MLSFQSETSHDDELMEINVIPLIDVLLVLLIFFMASASFVASGGVDIKLPEAGSQSSVAQETSIVVSVSREGELLVDGKNIERENLQRTLNSRAANPGGRTSVVVRADTAAQHGAVVEVLDAAKRAGINDIAIAAQLSKD